MPPPLPACGAEHSYGVTQHSRHGYVTAHPRCPLAGRVSNVRLPLPAGFISEPLRPTRGEQGLKALFWTSPLLRARVSPTGVWGTRPPVYNPGRFIVIF